MQSLGVEYGARMTVLKATWEYVRRCIHARVCVCEESTVLEFSRPDVCISLRPSPSSRSCRTWPSLECWAKTKREVRACTLDKANPSTKSLQGSHTHTSMRMSSLLLYCLCIHRRQLFHTSHFARSQAQLVRRCFRLDQHPPQGSV